MEPTIDPSQVSPDGWKVVEGLEKSWNRKFETNGLGMKMHFAPHNIRLKPEKARKEPLPLKPDKPWEAYLDGLSMTILQEDGLLRCWYGAALPDQTGQVSYQQERAVESGGRVYCYAESKDGFTWAKPNLGVQDFNGSKDNNIVAYMVVYASLFHDRQGAPDEQYKSLVFDKLPPAELARNQATGSYNSYCLYAMVSPDGYRWHTLTNNPLVRHFCDTQNITAWDPLLKKYVGFFRDHQGGRAISRSETEDFHSWPHPQPVLESGPEDPPDAEFYNNCYTTYPGNPSLRLFFPSVYHEATDHVDVRMAVSREGRAFSWMSHQPVIELGKPGEWDSGQIYCSPNLIRLPDNRLALPYAANTHTHNEGIFAAFYTNYPSDYQYSWAIWDDGRLAGIETDSDGEFYTNPIRPDGERLEINARTAPGGSVKVELCQDGAPAPGYSVAESVPLEGDHIWSPVQWKGNADISGLKGKKLQIHVVLNRAKIFGYRITTAAKEATGGS
jgi:hypothetical protein